MNLRRTFRGPIAWVVIAVLLIFGLYAITSSASSYKTVPLPKIENAIAAHQVPSAQLLDKEQEIQVTLKPSGPGFNGATKVQSAYTVHYDADALRRAQERRRDRHHAEGRPQQRHRLVLLERPAVRADPVRDAVLPQPDAGRRWPRHAVRQGPRPSW